MQLFGAKCNIVRLETEGIQQGKNTKTITKAILSTFQFPHRRLNVNPDGRVA